MQLFTAKAWESVTRDAIKQVYRGFQSGVGLWQLREYNLSIAELIKRQSLVLIAFRCTGIYGNPMEAVFVRMKQA